ncbi:MAG: hypothetical protein LBG80_08020 [Bacteroidales bacterium]|jgi:hypothetical protein|nr:hypothetical protein [Bacteroidales bacterium]
MFLKRPFIGSGITVKARKNDLLPVKMAICFSLICSCVNEQTNVNNNTTVSLENLIGKVVDLPDSLTPISYHTDDCPYKLKFWNNFLSKMYGTNTNCIFYMYINWTNGKIDSLSNPVRQKFDFPYTWYLDTDSQIFNKFGITDKKMQTMLLNERNEILLVGDPVFNIVLHELYVYTINNYEMKIMY